MSKVTTEIVKDETPIPPPAIIGMTRRRTTPRHMGQIREDILKAIGFESIGITKIMMRARIGLVPATKLLTELKGAGLVREVATQRGMAPYRDDRVTKWYVLTDFAKIQYRELLVVAAS